MNFQFIVNPRLASNCLEVGLLLKLALSFSSPRLRLKLPDSAILFVKRGASGMNGKKKYILASLNSSPKGRNLPILRLSEFIRSISVLSPTEPFISHAYLLSSVGVLSV